MRSSWVLSDEEQLADMKQLALYHPTTHSIWHSKRVVSGLLLITLLAVQVKIMLEGCFVMPYLSVPQSMVESMEGSCSEPASSAERVCLANCEFSISKPKLAGEISLFDVIVGLPAITFMVVLLVSLSPSIYYAVFLPTNGPPLYLLFFRLFFPLPLVHRWLNACSAISDGAGIQPLQHISQVVYQVVFFHRESTLSPVSIQEVMICLCHSGSLRLAKLYLEIIDLIS